ncbi:MAG: cytochrome d ubiquinol oxidase subunit II [Alphaproteobacteria bacterium]|nr:cytochrome d ubiquinol oxidase subunit II [Alphaproteobacteria bacterium]
MPRRPRRPEVTLELYLAGLLLAALVAYALLAGADFGGGIWDALATGPTARRQREVIAHAIGPIWEANHVWLIAVLVLLFACFPLAYAVLATTLHIPFTLLLLGIVLRGAAFAFRAYDTQATAVHLRWSRAFALGSVLAPLMLGISLGAAVSGRLRVDAEGHPTVGFVEGWWAPFPVAVGCFVVAVFAFLAAVYLTVAAGEDAELAERFRVRALASAVGVTVLAWVVFALTGEGAPHLREGLWSSWWGPPFQVGTAAVGLACLHALWTRRYLRARALAAAQVVAVVAGFGASQFPHLVYPDITFARAAAPPEVLQTVAVTMTVGLVLIAPAYAWLLRVFGPGATPRA